MKVSLHGPWVVVLRAALCAAAVVALVCARADVAQAQGPVPGQHGFRDAVAGRRPLLAAAE